MFKALPFSPCCCASLMLFKQSVLSGILKMLSLVAAFLSHSYFILAARSRYHVVMLLCNNANFMSLEVVVVVNRLSPTFRTINPTTLQLHKQFLVFRLLFPDPDHTPSWIRSNVFIAAVLFSWYFCSTVCLTLFSIIWS